MSCLTFTLEDLRAPERLERVLRQIDRELDRVAQVPALPSSRELALRLAPEIRNQLQATGIAPLNLQSLIPDQSAVFLVDTHANRLALYNVNDYDVGTPFYETDRTVFYVLVLSSGAKIWQYAGGIHDDSLANIVTDLGAGDAGFLYEVTDYDHILQWTGAAWQWGPGELGSGYYMLFEAAPNSAGASAWQLCDGSTVDRLNSNGTTTSVTLDDLTTSAYLKGGATSAAVAAASGAVASTTATNQAATATNQPTTATNNANTTGISLPDHSTIESLASGAGDRIFPDAAAAAHSVTDPGHNHTQNAHNHTQDAHNHTQDAHDHGPGALELRRLQKRLYFRR